MQYFRTAQPVPGKGNAWTFYEADDEDNILRMLTFLDGTEEVTLFPKPKIKKLIMKDRLEQTDSSQFETLWAMGES